MVRSPFESACSSVEFNFDAKGPLSCIFYPNAIGRLIHKELLTLLSCAILLCRNKHNKKNEELFMVFGSHRCINQKIACFLPFILQSKINLKWVKFLLSISTHETNM